MRKSTSDKIRSKLSPSLPGGNGGLDFIPPTARRGLVKNSDEVDSDVDDLIEEDLVRQLVREIIRKNLQPSSSRMPPHSL